MKLTTKKESRPHNSTYPKGGVSCSKDSFVDNQTLVFQIKFCGKKSRPSDSCKTLCGSLKDNTILKIRNYILTLLLLTTIHFKSFGTAQIPDILIYNGDTLSIYSNPLEQLDNIDTLREKLFGDKESYWTTACYRKYQAEWTLIDNQLYLTAIYSCDYYQDKIKADLKSLFGEKFINGKVQADWVTAKILSPQGKQLYYVHSHYESLYEREVVYEIINGQLIGTTTFDNSKSRKSIYSEDTTLLHFIYTNIDWDKLPNQDKPVKIVVQFSANEQGIIDSVEVRKGFNETYDNEAIRVVKSIPEWDVFYRRGQHERRSWVVPIVFSEENRQKYKKDRK
ncbi:MAG: hypothetical protein M0R38_00050 [Bacteroidia bacterium]|nr:hypothetical protein [Bacteroidia bacterium]